ncbi:hypothetical protein [Sphingomonas sp.]|uniref:hypothetical protein n=1 Tax=Sphingomonas sp. TaxID=28214 RepID=UPI0017BF45FD|nr:hypothetical protein [Sphingomonas sp.]MBA4762158.1 hypothetical protein [Sphingomonas sp.]
MSHELALAQVRPWGSTLRPVTVGRSHVMLQAPDGHLWDSVRDAFWGHHLDMCMCEDQTDQLELMRATLRCVAEEMHRIDPGAMISNLFDGSELFFRSYMLNLSNREMLEHTGTVFKHAKLSAFGWSVLAMLEATKPVIVNHDDATQQRSAAIQRGELRILAN